MKNIKMVVAYDGTAYLGWQKNDSGNSVEAILENALTNILQHKIVLQAASRTDAGVHAKGQVVNFFCDTELTLDRLKRSINGLLPSDVSVKHIEVCDNAFHPTLDCLSKEYHYQLTYDCVQYPHERFYAWHYPYDLNIEAMRKAIPFLCGTHDFSAFCNVKKNASYADHIRTVNEIILAEFPQKRLLIKVIGNHFLYKMVRNIVGTLVYVGRGIIQCADVPRILNQKDRKIAGITAPAHGLTLHKINY